MDSGPTSRFRTARNMPSWVNESSDRVGPPPPPPPIIPTDPEYEVIDVANQQQYSNAPPPVPLKSPDIKRITVMKCDLCGSVTPIVRCEQCDSNLFCASCDDRYHRHPKRQSHARKVGGPPALAGCSQASCPTLHAFIVAFRSPAIPSYPPIPNTYCVNGYGNGCDSTCAIL
uniref:Uncharacterized protein n=1 Tax=Anopheles atroparvus TaxID=41427 RepID=A0AAG5DS84_ANOAO